MLDPEHRLRPLAARMEKESNESPKPGGKRTGRRPRRRAAAGLDPALIEAFKKVPDSRAEMVARARQFARDPDYPSDQIIRFLSEILATHLEFDGYSY